MLAPAFSPLPHAHRAKTLSLVLQAPWPARPRRRPLPSRCQAGSAAQPGESLKARIASSFDQLFVTMEGKQYISVEKVGGLVSGQRAKIREGLPRVQLAGLRLAGEHLPPGFPTVRSPLITVGRDKNDTCTARCCVAAR